MANERRRGRKSTAPPTLNLPNRCCRGSHMFLPSFKKVVRTRPRVGEIGKGRSPTTVARRNKGGKASCCGKGDEVPRKEKTCAGR